MSGALAGSVAGLGLALGLLLVLASLTGRRTPSLAARVIPYLPDGAHVRDELASRSNAVGFGLVGLRDRARTMASVTGLAGWIDRTLGGRRSVTWRLDALGEDRAVDDFRVDQALGAGLGGLVGLGAAGLVSVATGGVAFVPACVLTFAGLLLGALAPDWRLTRDVRRREERIAADLPVVAELLALAVTAGEGVVGALERVSTSCGGVLAGEFGRVLAEVNSGTRLTTALENFSGRTRVGAAARLVDVIVVSLERGTPLGEVLRAQAADVTNARRQELVEESGRRSIAMLVPVVFLILPVTVVFAVYPGLVSIVSLAR